MKKKIITVIIVVFYLGVSSILYASDHGKKSDGQINLKVFVQSQNYLYQQQAGGGGSGNGVYKSRSQVGTLNHQLSWPIPDNPRIIYDPADEDRSPWTEQNYVPYHMLTHFEDWSEAKAFAKKQGFVGKFQFQTTPVMEVQPFNRRGLNVLRKFPQNGYAAFGIFQPLPSLTYHRIGVHFVESVLKSMPHVDDAIVVLTKYHEGMSANNSVAANAGVSFFNNPFVSTGVSGGSNSTVGRSGQYTGWMVEGIGWSYGTAPRQQVKPASYNPVPTQGDKAISPFYDVTATGESLTEYGVKAFWENVNILKKHKKALYGRAINLDIITLDKTGAESLVNALKEQYSRELRPVLGKIREHFRYTIIPAGQVDTKSLNKINAVHLVQMDLRK